MNNKETRRSGVGVLGLLGIAFIILKLCKVIEWSWLWVLAPFWSGIVLFILIVIISVIVVWFEEHR